jgi:Mesyanzhinovviridae DNA primase
VSTSSPDETLTPDYKASIEFLRLWCPEGRWVTTAIDPKGRKNRPLVTRTFEPADASDCETWLKEQGDDGMNLYFQVNPLRVVINGKKLRPSRKDVARLVALHVDVDPPTPAKELLAPDRRADLDAYYLGERERILGMLREPPSGIPPPTCINFSGGGYQAFWVLELPRTLDGTAADYEDAALYNKRLEDVFGGDSCHSIEHLMRLVGTRNLPNQKKREEKGRVPALAAQVEWHPDRVYGIGEFEKAPEVAAATSVGAKPVVTIDAANVVRVQDLDAELPSTVPPVVKRVIACGRDEMNTEPHRAGWSRSEWQWWATCEMARQRVKPEVIFSILTDPDWKISETILDKGRSADRYAQRQIDRACALAEDDPLLAEINSRHASVIVGGSSRVIREHWDPVFKRRAVEYLKKDAFKDFWNTRRATVAAGKGKTEEMPAGEWWFRHRLRRSYEDVTYAPGEELPEGIYNLWQGFAVSPAEGDCGLYLAHLREVICSGNAEHFDYLIRWMAYAVQRPGEPGHVAVALRGEKGAGKGKFAEHFGALWGRHFVQITNPDHLTKFNSLIEQASVVFLDEATRPSDKRHESILKGMVTEKTVQVERKGVDVVTRMNVLHLILASNDLSIVRATGNERRYFVLDVASARLQDHAYFAAIDEQMFAGGHAALLKALLDMDLSGFNVRRVPKTAALQDQVHRNLETMDEWLLTLLLDGRLPNNVARSVKGHPRAIPNRAWWGPSSHLVCDGLRHHAEATVPRLRDESDVALGTFLDGWGITSPERGGRRSRVFPPLPELRAAWCAKHGPREWPGGADVDWMPVGDEDNAVLG